MVQREPGNVWIKIPSRYLGITFLGSAGMLSLLGQSFRKKEKTLLTDKHTNVKVANVHATGILVAIWFDINTD